MYWMDFLKINKRGLETKCPGWVFLKILVSGEGDTYSGLESTSSSVI